MNEPNATTGSAEIEMYIDGASRGNPGPSGIGVVICRNGKAIKNLSAYIGNATNNIAEYTALIHGLKECLALKAGNIQINTDSELLCRQINKIYKIKSPNILALYDQALQLLSGFKDARVRHIPRENNRGADKLAAKAVNEALKKALL